MIRTKSIFILAGISAVLSCAPTPTRVIEPIEPGAASPDDEGGFVLSRKPNKKQAAAEYPVHLEGKWYPFRADHLGISQKEAVDRDRKIATTTPPQDFWDQQTAVEAVSVWSALCNECHGGRRQLKDALEMPAPATKWGVGEGLFFGKRRPYTEIFNTISQGGPPVNGEPSEMPKWADRLSREQIWSLIYFLEFQSGGIEGRFPPSLYPRRSGR